MLEFIYQSGWGAFAIMLFFQVPFVLFFLFVVFRKSKTVPTPSKALDANISKLKNVWIAVVAVLFVTINVVSIQYFPSIASARVENSGIKIQDVSVSAQSWSYDISKTDFKVGQAVRFSAESTDTVHGFALYHPSGKVLFTMMLIPGIGKASIIHTFKDAGTYKVRCLEYCGAAHHEMSDELIVTASAS